MLQYIDSGDTRIIGGKAIPFIARVEKPLLHMAIVTTSVCWPGSVNGQAVLVRSSPLKLKAGTGPTVVSGAAVSISKDGVMADGKHTVPLIVVFPWLVLDVLVIRAIHVPEHRKARVGRRLAVNIAAQSN